MLSSTELTKKYLTKTAVDHVTMELAPGHTYAMLGPNGSGKTTWMKMASGLVKPTSGTITYGGRPIGVETRKAIAYMSTEPYFYPWMTVRDAGEYYRDFFEDYDGDTFRRLLDRMELQEDMKVKALSTGMTAKLKIAVTLARRAEVYLLDEPLNGIDLLAREEIVRSIIEAAGGNVTLLLSSHLVEELESIADYAIFMKEGHLVSFTGVEELREMEGKSVVEKYREIYGHAGSTEGEEIC